jgi:UDP-N-acetylmuramate--alanine ligase
VVVSTAIPAANPEVAAARERGLTVLSRAELLAQLTRLKRTIAVAGAHGKTTTSSMVAHALLGCGLDPAYVIGGTLTTTGTNAAWGSGDWLVVEADESDRSFLALDVDVAIVTNVELDHHTEWPSLADLRAAFARFLAGAPQAVLPEGDEAVLALRGEAGGSATTITFSAWSGPPLAVPGEHNRRNAAGGGGAGGRAAGGRGGGARDLRRGGAPVPDAGPHRGGRGGGRRLRAPPDRGRRRDRGRARVGEGRGRERARDRHLPAAPVLAHPAPRGGVRAGARGG